MFDCAANILDASIDITMTSVHLYIAQYVYFIAYNLLLHNFDDTNAHCTSLLTFYFIVIASIDHILASICLATMYVYCVTI